MFGQHDNNYAPLTRSLTTLACCTLLTAATYAFPGQQQARETYATPLPEQHQTLDEMPAFLGKERMTLELITHSEHPSK